MLEGDLGDFAVPDVLRLLALTSKTGRLRLRTDVGAGRVDLAGGRVRDASADATRLPIARRLLGRGLVDGGALRAVLADRQRLPTDRQLARMLVERGLLDDDVAGEVLHEQTTDAVFDLLLWTSGRFRFDSAPGDEERSDPQLEVEELLHRTQERLEQWEAIVAATGDGAAAVTVRRPEHDEVAVGAEGWELLGLADGRRTIDELARLSGRGRFGTRRILVHLLELGVVTVGERGSVEQLLDHHQVLEELETALADQPDPASEVLAGPAHERTDDEDTSGSAYEAEGPRTPAAVNGTLDEVATPVGAGVSTSTDDGVRKALPQSEDAAPAGAGAAASAADTVPAATAVRAGAARKGRGERLGPDPSIDEDVVHRLIAGVEGL